MDRTLVEFVHALRGADVRVSTAEILDAMKVVEQIGYLDKQLLKEALAATLAKTLTEKAPFEQTFEAFFHRAGSADAQTEPNRESADEAARSENKVPNPQAGQGQGEGSGAGGSGSALGDLLLSNDRAALEMALNDAARQVDLTRMSTITQRGLYGRRMMMRMGLEALEAEMAQLNQSPQAADQQRAQALQQARQRLREQVKQFVEQHYLLFATAKNKQLREEVIRSVRLDTLREFKDVKRIVQKMAKKLVSRYSRRKRIFKTGVLDVRNTLRKNVGFDGVLFRMQWRSVRQDRPDVMVLCDVSRSVSQYSRFLLMFLYSLAEVIPRVRAFAFSSHLGEVTQWFEQHDLDEAIDLTLQSYGMGSTDYGAAWEQFFALVGDKISKKTTLIILGDARNNFGDARLALFKSISERARQVIWLNPEGKYSWGSGDSEMKRYAPYCSVVENCNT
ncbi:MAG TPA: VWA domain-containing protein, partial [Pseudomonadales bacterium]|nr:VWA domain-containing protein [Pseudomonadales bacterium]